MASLFSRTGLTVLVFSLVLIPLPAAFAADPQDHLNRALEEAEKEMSAQDERIQQAREDVRLQRAKAHLRVVEKDDTGSIVPPAPEETSLAYRPAEELEPVLAQNGELPGQPSVPASSRMHPLSPGLEKKTAAETRIEGIPYDRSYTPPDGVLAYQVALSDNVIALGEAIEIALKNSVLLESYEMRIKGAERKLMEAKRGLFPSVTAEASANGGLVSGVGYQGEHWKLNLSQPIFDGGESIFTLRQTQASLEADKAKYAKERAEMIHRVGEAYRGYVGADYNMSYQGAVYEEIMPIKERTVKEYQQKLTPEVEYLDIMALANQVQFSRESAESDLLSAKLLLAQEMGLNAEQPLPVDETLRYTEIPIDLNEVRSLAQTHNWDIRVKETAAKAAYFNMKVFEAKKMPHFDIRGSTGLLGEQQEGAGFHNDLEKEHSLTVQGNIPLGPNSVDYNYSRRFFGPTVLNLTGSEDYRHRVAFNLLDKLADLTDNDIAKAEYLQTKAELQKERIQVDNLARQAYYSYREALLQVATSLSKIKYREKQINILRLTTGMQEASVSSLVSEIIQLSEDRFSYVRAIADIHGAVSNINRLIGIEGYYSLES